MYVGGVCCVQKIKKVLIVFPDEWVAYSPTILNLVEMIKKKYLVRVVCFDINIYNNKGLNSEIYKLLNINYFLYRVLCKLRVINIFKILVLYLKIRNQKYDIVIGVDVIGVIVCQLIFKKCFYLSLEIKKDKLLRFIKWNNILGLIIQTKERLAYLCKNNINFPVILMQNAPIIDDDMCPVKHDISDNIKIIYMGNICKAHGVLQCIDLVNQSSLNIKLYLKGIIPNDFEKELRYKYKQMIDESKLVIDKTYIEQNNIKEYLSQFMIGFCFYDFNLIAKDDFNYVSCPSGKLFNYYMAGVPVIATNILGLKSVLDFETGVLVNSYNVEEIESAIKQILNSYECYVENCYKASQHYDFKVAYQELEKILEN